MSEEKPRQRCGFCDSPLREPDEVDEVVLTTTTAGDVTLLVCGNCRAVLGAAPTTNPYG